VRQAICVSMLLITAVLLQLAVIPSIVPPVLRPDVGMLIGMAVLAYSTREFALITLFLLGVQADLFGSARFGLLTLCYLLSAGLILWIAWRELTRGDLLAAWVGGVAGTFFAHLLYVGIGRICGLDIAWGQATATLFVLLIAGCVWGLPFAWACGNFLYAFNLLSPAVKERWAAEARLAAQRRGKVMRS
jgi:hypothetical protein